VSLVAATVSEFGRSLGLDDLQLRQRGAVVLQLQSIGTLAIDRAGPSEESVVISLARTLHRPDEVNWLKLLARSHYRARLSLPVRLGAFRDQLVLSVVLPQEDFTLATLHEVIRLLDGKMSQVEGLA
jgi:type III secretion system chaperone SycN